MFSLSARVATGSFPLANLLAMVSAPAGAPNNSMPISWRLFFCKLVQKIRPARKRAKLRETLPQVHYKQNLGATEGLFQQELLQHMQQPFLVYRLVHPGDIGQKADPRLPQPLATRHQKWHTPG